MRADLYLDGRAGIVAGHDVGLDGVGEAEAGLQGLELGAGHGRRGGEEGAGAVPAFRHHLADEAFGDGIGWGDEERAVGETGDGESAASEEQGQDHGGGEQLPHGSWSFIPFVAGSAAGVRIVDSS